MVPTAGCGHRPVGSRSREGGCKYIFPYAPPGRESVARAVVVVPDDRQSWFPLLAAATVRSVPVAAKGGAGTFFRIYHQKGKVSVVFRQWGMWAVEVDFRQG